MKRSIVGMVLAAALVVGCGNPEVDNTEQAVDIAESHLDDASRQYLAQAGVANVSEVGGTMWVDACRVRAQQGAGTFNSGKTETCTWANVRPGWIILDTQYEILENKNNRGSASVSSTNGPVTIDILEFGSKFKAAGSVAIKAGDKSAEGKLDAEYQRLNGYVMNVGVNGNNLIAKVVANGGLFAGSVIEIQARAKLLRVY